LLRGLPKQAELILADTAFHAENQAIIGQRQVIDLIEIGDEGVEVPADLEQLGPVFGVAREPGGFEAQDDADLAQGDSAAMCWKPARWAKPLAEMPRSSTMGTGSRQPKATALSRRPSWIRVLSAW
jgi:hypothetical protein